jgi:DTW domain-containing protein YfiP
MRTRNQPRCSRCEIRPELCFCSLIPELSLETRVIMIMHHRELNIRTNTARLLHAALKNSEIRIRGDLNIPFETEGLIGPERHTLYLYPTEDARELSLEFVASFQKPVTLIIPDGSWRQASKMRNRIAVLRDVPCVKLPSGPRSVYHFIRQEPHAHSLSTYEAAARALGFLEKDRGPEVQKELEALFLEMVRRRIRQGKNFRHLEV